MIDIHDPAHAEALRWACETKAKLERVSTMAFAGGSRAGKTTKHKALEALESPLETVRIIRWLIDRAGLKVYFDEHVDVIDGPSICMSLSERGIGFEYWVAGSEEPKDWLVIPMRDACSLIIRLLALDPNVGAEAVLRALRGET